MRIMIRIWMTGQIQIPASDRKRNMNNPAKEIINCRNIFCRVYFVMKNKTYNKKKILVVFLCAVLIILGLIGRLVYLMIFDAEYYQELAEDLHEREREIKASRGEIVDRNGVVLATNKTVCTISVIHSQIEDPRNSDWMRRRCGKRSRKYPPWRRSRQMWRRRSETGSGIMILRE